MLIQYANRNDLIRILFQLNDFKLYLIADKIILKRYLNKRSDNFEV
jgi:hypothetical protein